MIIYYERKPRLLHLPRLRAAQGLEAGALQEALDADLKKVDSALDAARARLADYSGQHQQAIQVPSMQT